MCEMTCEEFFESYMDAGNHWNTLADEMYWEGRFSADQCFASMRRMAEREGVTLTDVAAFQYEDFFYNAYRNTEKGLS